MTLKRQKKISAADFQALIRGQLAKTKATRPSSAQRSIAKLVAKRKESIENPNKVKEEAEKTLAEKQRTRPKAQQEALNRLSAPAREARERREAEERRREEATAASNEAANNANQAPQALIRPAIPPPPPLNLTQRFFKVVKSLTPAQATLANELHSKGKLTELSELKKFVADPVGFLSVNTTPKPPRTKEQLLAEGKRIFDQGGFEAYSKWAKSVSEEIKNAIPATPPVPTIAVTPPSVVTTAPTPGSPVTVVTNVGAESTVADRSRVNAEAADVVTFGRTTVSTADLEAEALAAFRGGGFEAYSQWARDYVERLKKEKINVVPSTQPTIWDSQLRRIAIDVGRGESPRLEPPVVREQQVLSEGQKIFKEGGFEAYAAWARQYTVALNNNQFTVKQSEERDKALKDALRANGKVTIIRQEETQPSQVVQWRIAPASKPVIPSTTISSAISSNIRALSGDSPYKSLLLTMLLRRFTKDVLYSLETTPGLVDAAISRTQALTATIKINRYSRDDVYAGVRSDIETLNKELIPVNVSKYSEDTIYNEQSLPNLKTTPEPAAKVIVSNQDGISIAGEDGPTPIARALSFFRSFTNPAPTTAVASNSNSSENTSSVEQPYDGRKANTTGLVTRPKPSDVLQDLENLLLPDNHPKGGRPVFDQLYTNNRRVTANYPEGEMAGVSLRGVQESSSPGEEGSQDKIFSYEDDRKLVHGIDRGFTQNISAASPRTNPAVQQTDALQRVAGVIGAGYQQYFPFLFETENRKTPSGGYRKQTCFLQATLNQMQESYAPNWTSKSFFGRTEKVHTYTETDRVLDIQFVIFADSLRQLQNVYERVNWLAQQTYGQYEAYGQSVNRLGAGPLVRLTIGDIFQRIPGYIRNLSLNWDHSGAGGKWEITEGLKMPVSCQVSLSYQVIHPDMPDRDMNFYWGMAKGMGGGLIQTNRNKEGTEDSYVRQISGAVPVSDHEVDQYSTFYSNNEVPAAVGTQEVT